MSQYNGFKVLSAALNNDIHIPGVGAIRKELSSVANAMDKEIKMTLDEPFVVLEVKRKDSGQMMSVAISVNQFSYLVMEKAVFPPRPLKE